MSAEGEWQIKTTVIWRIGMLLVQRLITRSWSRFSLSITISCLTLCQNYCPMRNRQKPFEIH